MGSGDDFLSEWNCPSVIGIVFVAIWSVVSGLVVSIAGDAVVDPPLVECFDLPGRSNDGGCVLSVSAGCASLLGVLADVDGICRWGLACCGASSYAVGASYPLSRDLSAIEVPVNGVEELKRALDGGWVADNEDDQLNNEGLIDLGVLLGFWLVPVWVLDERLAPIPSIAPVKLNIPLVIIDDIWVGVLPIGRSPDVDCRCPLPIGVALSIDEIPLIDGLN